MSSSSSEKLIQRAINATIQRSKKQKVVNIKEIVERMDFPEIKYIIKDCECPDIEVEYQDSKIVILINSNVYVDPLQVLFDNHRGFVIFSARPSLLIFYNFYADNKKCFHPYSIGGKGSNEVHNVFDEDEKGNSKRQVCVYNKFEDIATGTYLSKTQHPIHLIRTGEMNEIHIVESVEFQEKSVHAFYLLDEECV